MNIIDALIILLILMFGVIGFQRGFFKQTVVFVGEIIAIVVAFFLKNPIADFLCLNLPFFNFGGLFKGVQAINIFMYQVIAFIFVLAILYIILNVLIRISGIVEKILKFTIILGIPSKILGGIFGLIEGILVTYIALFVLKQPMFQVPFIDDSKLTPFILENVPFLSDALDPTVHAITEIYDLVRNDELDSNGYNREAIRIMLEYHVVSPELIEGLDNKGKVSVPDLDSLLEQYQ